MEEFPGAGMEVWRVDWVLKLRGKTVKREMRGLVLRKESEGENTRGSDRWR